MMKTFFVFVALAKDWYRSKAGVFFSILFPVMLLLIFATVFGGAEDVTYNLHLQNQDVLNGEPSELSEQLERALGEVESLNVQKMPSDASVREYIRENDSFSWQRVLIIPENFQERIKDRSAYVGARVTLRTVSMLSERIEDNLEQIEIWKSHLERFIQAIESEEVGLIFLASEGDQGAPVVRSIISSIMISFDEELIGADPIISIEAETTDRRGLSAADYYLPGLIAAFIMANGIMGVTAVTSEYNRNGVKKCMAATSLDKKSWITGTLLTQALISFVLTIIMIAVGWIVFGIKIIPNHYSLPLILLGSILFTTMGVTIGGLIKDVEAASAAGNAIGFPMMFLSGAFIPFEMMPGFVQAIGRALPLYYFHQGLERIMIFEQPGEALGYFAIIGVLATIFLVTAIKTTKWKEL